MPFTGTESIKCLCKLIASTNNLKQFLDNTLELSKFWGAKDGEEEVIKYLNNLKVSLNSISISLSKLLPAKTTVEVNVSYKDIMGFTDSKNFITEQLQIISDDCAKYEQVALTEKDEFAVDIFKGLNSGFSSLLNSPDDPVVRYDWPHPTDLHWVFCIRCKYTFVIYGYYPPPWACPQCGANINYLKYL
ncbi:MAG: hypothetical protein JXR95_12490 [Deltaproteobacteria bacterium]|nr:hypothetical protein [Deltaproteobacteria bacterium]